MRRTVHNAQITVKSKRTVMPCILHNMSIDDDRPETAKRLQKAREARGFGSAADAAKFFGWKYDSYIQHENGTRGLTRSADRYAKAFRVSEAWLLTGEGPGPGTTSIDSGLAQLYKNAPEEADRLRADWEAALQRRLQEFEKPG